MPGTAQTGIRFDIPYHNVLRLLPFCSPAVPTRGRVLRRYRDSLTSSPISRQPRPAYAFDHAAHLNHLLTQARILFTPFSWVPASNVGLPHHDAHRTTTPTPFGRSHEQRPPYAVQHHRRRLTFILLDNRFNSMAGTICCWPDMWTPDHSAAATHHIFRGEILTPIPCQATETLPRTHDTPCRVSLRARLDRTPFAHACAHC